MSLTPVFLTHVPTIERAVQLARHGSGVVTYDVGCGGREACLMAAARVAHVESVPLVVLDVKALTGYVKDYVAEAPTVEYVTPQRLTRGWEPPNRYALAVSLDAVPSRRAKGWVPFHGVIERAAFPFVSRHPWTLVDPRLVDRWFTSAIRPPIHVTIRREDVQ